MPTGLYQPVYIEGLAQYDPHHRCMCAEPSTTALHTTTLLCHGRYRKGETVEWAGRTWYQMHEEIMIVASEAVLPLGITAMFATTGGSRSKAHARWGYYMIAAVALELFSGWMRTKGLEAKHANFSLLHRVTAV